MITTTLALVIITTLVFGTFMPVIRNCLFPPMKEEDEMDEKMQQVMLTSAGAEPIVEDVDDHQLVKQ